MKILFVRPRPDPETIGLQHVMVVEPLELEVLAATLGPEDEPVIADLIIDPRDIREVLAETWPDVVCVTGYVTNVPGMISIAQEAKAWTPTCVTVAGGVHCEVVPGDLDHEAIDFRVVRNAVSAFPALIDALRDSPRGTPKTLPPEVLRPGEKPGALPAHRFEYRTPRRDLTAGDRHGYFYIFHAGVALLKTSFGCPYQCSFCFCREITSHGYHERSLDEVLAELAEIEETNVYIVDDDFLVSRRRVLDFLTALDDHQIHKKYLLYGRADFIAENPDLMEAFAARGLRTVIVGLESFEDDELARYDKGTTAADNKRALGVLRKLGVDVYATIILAPDWGREDFRRCGDYLLAHDVRYVNLQPFTPLKGTGLEVAEKDLLVPYSDFGKWDLAHLTVPPTKLSERDFYREIIRLYQRVLFRPRVLLDYLRTYPLKELWKMSTGSAKVRRQYLAKMREAGRRA